MGRELIRSTLRGAIGFFAGAIVIGLAAVPEFLIKWPDKQGPPAYAFWLMVLGVFICGATGATVLMWGRAESHVTAKAALGFGIGFVVASFAVLFTSISLQGGGRPEIAWGAIGFGVGYAVGGAIGASFLSLRLTVPGAIAFGLPGALSGALAFFLAGRKTAPGAYVASMAAGTSALLLPFVLGGALFGAAVELFGGAD